MNQTRTRNNGKGKIKTFTKRYKKEKPVAIKEGGKLGYNQLKDSIIKLRAQEKDTKRIVNWFEKDVERFLEKICQFEKELIARFGNGEVDKGDVQLKNRFAGYCDSILESGESLTNSIIDRRVRREVKKLFRKVLNPYLRGNPIIERCLSKPRGYPGDYGMMEMAYNTNLYLPRGLRGFFDRYFWDQYECVRCRKDVAKERIRKIVIPKTNPVRQILSLGGGPCREWYDLYSEVRSSNNYTQSCFMTLDQDPEALDFAKNRLKNNPLLKQANFIRDSLLTFSTSKFWQKLQGRFDLIYGMGIANYFYDETLARMVTRAFDLLKPGGQLIVEHKDRDAFKFAPADWLADWTFVIRGEPEFKKVFSDALRRHGLTAKHWIERDKTGELMFGVAEKQK